MNKNTNHSAKTATNNRPESFIYNFKAEEVFPETLYTWVKATSRLDIAKTLAKVKPNGLRKIRDQLDDLIKNKESARLNNLIEKGMEKAGSKWITALDALIHLTTDENSRENFCLYVQIHEWVATQELESIEELKSIESNVAKMRPESLKKLNQLFSNYDAGLYTERLDNWKAVQTMIAERIQGGQPSVQKAKPHSEASKKALFTDDNRSTSKKFRYVSFEKSPFKQKDDGKVSWVSWLGQKSVQFLKVVFTICNSIAIRRAVLLGLTRTALQVWSAQTIALSTSLVGGLLIWQGLGWLLKKASIMMKRLPEGSSKLKATIFGIDKVNKTLNIKLNATNAVEVISYDTHDTKGDAFTRKVEAMFPSSQNRMPEKYQKSVAIHVKDADRLYSLSF